MCTQGWIFLCLEMYDNVKDLCIAGLPLENYWHPSIRLASPWRRGFEIHVFADLYRSMFAGGPRWGGAHIRLRLQVGFNFHSEVHFVLTTKAVKILRNIHQAKSFVLRTTHINFPCYTSRSQKLRSRSNSLTKSQWLNGYSILLFSSNQLGLESSKAFRSAMTRIHLPRRYVSSLESLPEDVVWYDIYWVLWSFAIFFYTLLL